MPNCLFDLFLADERQIACPRICGESDTQSFQKSVVVRAGILLGREKCRRKFAVCNRAVQRETSSSQANSPEYDCASDRMDSVSQRNQAGRAGDYQRNQADPYCQSEDDDHSPRTGIPGCGCGFQLGDYCALSTA